MRRGLLFFALATLACEALVELDDLSGGKDAASSAAAPDWTSSFLAVYRFDLAGASLGIDSSGNGLDLLAIDAPAPASDAAQGPASVLLAQGRFSQASTTFATGGGSVTFGGWFRAPATDAHITGHWDGDDGYRLERFETALRCTISDNDNDFAATTPSSTFPPDEWVHGVCQYDDPGARIVTHVNGSNAGETGQVFVLSSSSEEFRIGSTSLPFTGLADEVFVIHAALSTAAIRRIWACGIDGSRCRCEEADTASYADCGRAQPGCIGLPPCDQPEP